MYVVRQTCFFIINDCMKYLVDITFIKKILISHWGFLGVFFVKILQFCVKLVSMGDFGKSIQNIKFMGSQFFYYNLRMSSSNQVEVFNCLYNVMYQESFCVLLYFYSIIIKD